MKKLTVLFVLTALLVFSVSAGANDFEFVGGVTYTTIDSDELDLIVDGIEVEYKVIEAAVAEDTFATGNVNFIDEINGTFGFFAGVKTPVNEKVKIGGQYERYSLSRDADYKITLDYSDIDNSIYYIKDKYELELVVNGVVGTASYKVNKMIGLNGSLGYYFGNFDFKNNGSLETVNDPVDGDSVQSFSNNSNIDVNGFGFKFGADINYPISEQISLIGAANYRILSLTPKDEDKYGDDEMDLDGIELSGGISYKF